METQHCRSLLFMSEPETMCKQESLDARSHPQAAYRCVLLAIFNRYNTGPDVGDQSPALGSVSALPRRHAELCSPRGMHGPHQPPTCGVPNGEVAGSCRIMPLSNVPTLAIAAIQSPVPAITITILPCFQSICLGPAHLETPSV